MPNILWTQSTKCIFINIFSLRSFTSLFNFAFSYLIALVLFETSEYIKFIYCINIVAKSMGHAKRDCDWNTPLQNISCWNKNLYLSALSLFLHFFWYVSNWDFQSALRSLSLSCSTSLKAHISTMNGQIAKRNAWKCAAI